jgi:hypothetical protein
MGLEEKMLKARQVVNREGREAKRILVEERGGRWAKAGVKTPDRPASRMDTLTLGWLEITWENGGLLITDREPPRMDGNKYPPLFIDAPQARKLMDFIAESLEG